MYLRHYIELVEAFLSNAQPRPVADPTPADRFISVAQKAIDATFDGHVSVSFLKLGPNRVQASDNMNGVRTRAHFEVIRKLTELAQKNGVRLSISGGSGRYPFR